MRIDNPTLGNAAGTSLTLTDPLTVPNGGSGLSVTVPNQIIVGGSSSTSNLQQITAGSAGQPLVSGGGSIDNFSDTLVPASGGLTVSGNLEVDGYSSINIAPSTDVLLYVSGALSGGPNPRLAGIYVTPTFSSGLGNRFGVRVLPYVQSGSFAVGTMVGYMVEDVSIGSGSSVGTYYGIQVNTLSSAGTSLAIDVVSNDCSFGGNVSVLHSLGVGQAFSATSPLSIAGLPTSSAGLSTGDVWNLAGVLQIV